MLIADFKDKHDLWRKSRTINYVQHNTVSGTKWRDMNSRCLVGGSAQQRRVHYEGCFVSPNFQDFQFFTCWHRNQIGYALPDYALDKDLLLHGNKEYSEDNCVLIPKSLNCFLTDARAARGNTAQGVHLRKDSGKYSVHLNVGNGRKYLGLFGTEEEAFFVYKKSKEAEAKRWARRLDEREFLVDERVIQALQNWELRYE